MAWKLSASSASEKLEVVEEPEVVVGAVVDTVAETRDMDSPP